MRLTTKTDYCLRVLIYLQQKNERVKIKEIADNYAISKNHLSVVVNELSELGYIKTTLGPNGGIEFNKAFGNHTLYDLVSKVEEFDIASCFNAETNTCTISPHCKLKSMLKKATHSFLDELKNYKIKDLV